MRQNLKRDVIDMESGGMLFSRSAIFQDNRDFFSFQCLIKKAIKRVLNKRPNEDDFFIDGIYIFGRPLQRCFGVYKDVLSALSVTTAQTLFKCSKQKKLKLREKIEKCVFEAASSRRCLPPR